MPKGSSVWLRAVLIVLVMINSVVVRAAEGDFNEGLDAYLVGNYAKARSIWAPLAESGDAVAAFNMGVLYAQGLGVEADAARAVRWYRQSAESGYAPAQFNLGSAYEEGTGVEVDKRLAALWWRKAAAQDYSQALFNLATLYLRGDGVIRDEDKARQLYQRASAMGDLRAQLVLEQMVVTALAEQTVSGESPVAKPATADARGSSNESPATRAADRPSGTRIKTPDRAEASHAPQQALQGTGQHEATDRGATMQAELATNARGPDWLQRQNPAHYTVQVFAFSDLGSAQQYAQAAGMAEDLVIARASTQGRIWYKAFYGSYPDLAQAKAARDRLKTRVGRHVPWIRRMGDVFAELLDAPAAAAAPTPAADTEPAELAASSKARPAAQVGGPTGSAGPESTAPEQAGVPQETTALRQIVVHPPASTAPEQDGAGQADKAGREAPHIEPQLIPDARDRERLREGQSYFNRQDYTRALEAWRPLAAKGIAQAQYGLGFMYESGWGVERDYEQAFVWYERAARQGHAQSQYNLGMLFHNGLGVKRSEAKAFFWIQNAADGGDPRAGEYIQQATSN